MPVLNDSCYTGPLRSEDLEAARQHSTGAIHMAHPYTGPDDARIGGGQYREKSGGSPAWWPERRSSVESCATEGGIHADPVPSGVLSMRRHRKTRNRIALALLLGAVGLIARLIWPVVGG